MKLVPHPSSIARTTSDVDRRLQELLANRAEGSTFFAETVHTRTLAVAELYVRGAEPPRRLEGYLVAYEAFEDEAGHPVVTVEAHKE